RRADDGGRRGRRRERPAGGHRRIRCAGASAVMRVAVIGGWAPSLIKFRGPLLAALVARGHEVIAMAPERSSGEPEVRAGLASLGVRFEPIELQRAGLDPLADARALRGLVQRLRALAP